MITNLDIAKHHSREFNKFKSCFQPGVQVVSFLHTIRWLVNCAYKIQTDFNSVLNGVTLGLVLNTLV